MIGLVTYIASLTFGERASRFSPSGDLGLLAGSPGLCSKSGSARAEGSYTKTGLGFRV